MSQRLFHTFQASNIGPSDPLKTHYSPRRKSAACPLFFLCGLVHAQQHPPTIEQAWDTLLSGALPAQAASLPSSAQDFPKHFFFESRTEYQRYSTSFRGRPTLTGVINAPVTGTFNPGGIPYPDAFQPAANRLFGYFDWGTRGWLSERVNTHFGFRYGFVDYNLDNNFFLFRPSLENSRMLRLGMTWKYWLPRRVILLLFALVPGTFPETPWPARQYLRNRAVADGYRPAVQLDERCAAHPDYAGIQSRLHQLPRPGRRYTCCLPRVPPVTPPCDPSHTQSGGKTTCTASMLASISRNALPVTPPTIAAVAIMSCPARTRLCRSSRTAATPDRRS